VRFDPGGPTGPYIHWEKTQDASGFNGQPALMFPAKSIGSSC
jgi:hypothetical protein